MNLCHHGCGNEGKYQNKQGNWLCENTANKCPEVRKKNAIGLRAAHQAGKMRSGFTEEDRKKSTQAIEAKLATLPFEKQAWERQRATVIREQENKCLICDNFEWMGQPLKLQVDHIDGNNRNNVRDNLRALCPNCHSNTETFCGKNINGYQKATDEQILAELGKGISVRQVLINVGLTPKGGNYERVNKLKNK